MCEEHGRPRIQTLPLTEVGAVTRGRDPPAGLAEPGPSSLSYTRADSLIPVVASLQCVGSPVMPRKGKPLLLGKQG